MTKQKDLKRVVRERMQKTGESYTTARVHIVKPDYAKLAGMTDARVKAATGRDWAQWTKVLDAIGDKKHAALAKHLSSLGVPSWWSQMVTVGYERIRGMRARGQARSGSWRAGKSKTFAVPIGTLFKAFRKSLPAGVKVRTATTPKSMRITWDDGTSVHVGFLDKGAKSTVALEHAGLKSKADVDRVKKYWAEHFTALASDL
jgi:hypothetical protein